jgi:hypothetical protein
MMGANSDLLMVVRTKSSEGREVVAVLLLIKPSSSRNGVRDRWDLPAW